MPWHKRLLIRSGCLQVASKSPLADPTALPLRSAEDLAVSPVLVVAPHPDDECLGCGGAIALLRLQHCEVRVLMMSDGTMSHPNSRQYPAPVLRSLRESETCSAMGLLGVDAADITFLGLRDGAVPNQDMAGFGEAVASCRTYLQAVCPGLVCLPWRHDPHSDHRASWQILRTALDQISWPDLMPSRPRVIEYPIWDWDVTQRGKQIDRAVAWRLDIQSVLALKQEAIATYRSQVSDLIDDDPQGFRLTSEMLANFNQPWEVYLEEIEKTS